MKDPRTLSSVTVKEAHKIVSEAHAQKEWNRLRKMKKLPPQKCAQCEADFQPKRDWQKFCSSLCRAEWHKAALERELEQLRMENLDLRRQLKELQP